jgi:AraC-like DNA-binding protein
MELPRLTAAIHGIDYLRMDGAPQAQEGRPIGFRQNMYRMWYQMDGRGILQNATRGSFGKAGPGLLGIMECGERYTYLHQRGRFECFLMDFAVEPSRRAKCYWNSEVEGKCLLREQERLLLENLVFEVLASICNQEEFFGLRPASRILEMLTILFSKGLLLIEEEQFPRNKRRSLVRMAKSYMNTHYSQLRHQRALEQACGTDINHLNTLFKKETGTTLYQYLTRVRMEHAKHLLGNESATVSAAARQVGYPNGNSFSRAFRRHVGISPTSYRHQGGAR